jgi:LacI family transcriptional regulator
MRCTSLKNPLIVLTPAVQRLILTTLSKIAMITLKDIAAQTGVSIKTVSRVVNNEPHIAPEKRERILKLVRRLNYVPNPAARSLKGGKTQAIGVTTGGPNLVQVFDHPYMSRLYTGMAAAMQDTNYRLVFCHFKQVLSADEAVELAANRYADGIIYILLSVYWEQFKKDRIIQRYKKLGIPYVVIHSMNGTIGCHNVGLDGTAGGHAATRHLLEHGYGSVGFVGVQQKTPHVEDLFAGYQKALAEAGMPIRSEHVFHGASFVAADSTSRVDTIISLKNKRPRALFVAVSGYMPMLVRGLERAGIRVPEDLALIGFDEAHTAPYVDPALTYLEQPAIAKGKAAMELLLELIRENGNGARARTITITPELKMGRSCGCS